MEARDNKELAEPEACPIATQDIRVNLKNRQTAVNVANYGPSNPGQPNDLYWKAKADEFQGDVATAKTMRCGNCAAFSQTSKILGCIKKGIGKDANEVAQAGNLGYCEIFDFKCAAKRTCDAWISGGPITDKKKETEFVAGRDCGQDSGGTFGSNNVCAVGYGRPKIKGGYEPTRPGGKIPKDYKRPTSQGKKQKPKKQKDTTPPLLPPQKPEPPTPKTKREKATQSVKDLGIERVELPENEEAAEDISKSLQNLKIKGYKIPPPYQIFTDDIEARYGSAFAGSYAVAHQEEGTLKNQIIYSKNFNSSSMRENLAQDAEKGWFTSTDLFAHEYGHNAHTNNISYEESVEFSKGFGQGREAERSASIAGEVSQYAQKDPFEFVAETFAGHVSGKKYSKNVYSLYKKYKGPELK